MGKDSHSGVYFLIFFLPLFVETIAETFPIYANVCNVLCGYPELHYKVTAFLLKYVLRSPSDRDFMLYIKSNSAEFCIFAEDI